MEVIIPTTTLLPTSVGDKAASVLLLAIKIPIYVNIHGKAYIQKRMTLLLGRECSCNQTSQHAQFSSSLKDKEGERDQSALGIKLPVWSRLPGIPSLIAYPALLSSTHLQLLMYPQRRYQMPGVQMRQEETVDRSMWRQAQQIYVLIHSLLLQKQKYLISCFLHVLSFVLVITRMAK